jgi:dihydrofolate reductase
MRVVDEIIVSVIPVLLGKGKPMVGVLQEKVWLHLQKSKMYKNGTVQLFYTVQYR